MMLFSPATMFKATLLLALTGWADSQNVAIIGGGVSGSFAARYLADYDRDCKIEKIVVFEQGITDRPLFTTDNKEEELQGSRVSCVQLRDGTMVELGASIGYKGFHFVLDMIRGDPSIEIGTPFNTGLVNVTTSLDGMGVYDGNGTWSLVSSGVLKSLRKFQIAGRYGLDVIRLTKASRAAEQKSEGLQKLLGSNDPTTFYESPHQLWQAVDLENTLYTTFDSFLKAIGVENEVPWLRSYLPYQGALAPELANAINLVNYNQGNDQVNALTGLGSFAVTSGGLFSIVGGNYRIIQSALGQASNDRQNYCGRDTSLQIIPKKVTTVVKETDGFSIFAGQESLGTFDDIIVAAPLQHAKIDFYVQSHFDEAVLRPMPLAGLIKPTDASPEDGHSLFPESLPEPATRKFTQVVTTVVSNGQLNADYISLPDPPPRSIVVTYAGKASLFNITAITSISDERGIYKVFSSDKLGPSTLQLLFGEKHIVEFEKVWGGPYGGATPDYQGTGYSASFTLYDGSHAEDGMGAGKVYYPSAMEQAGLSCMEISAIGAKAVAKLLARQLQLVTPQKETDRDEL